MYTGNNPVSRTGLAALWHFDEGSGSVASDSSNNDNDGTVFGATWVESGLQSLNDYTWQAEAQNLVGSTFSNTTTPAVTAPMCIPTKPGLVLDTACTPGIGPTISTAWSYAFNATSYDLYREEGAIDSLIATVAQTSAASLRVGIDDNGGLGLTPLTSYSYYVIARGSAGDETSDTISLTTFDCSLPPPPVVTGQLQCVPNNDGILGGSSAAEASDPAWVPGQVGAAALDFDGIDDYVVTSSDMQSLFDDESVTIAAWIYPTSAGVIVDELGQTSLNVGWHDSQIEILSSGEVRVRVWNLASVSLGTASFNAWHHVVLRYDKATLTLDGFLDGGEASTDVIGDRAAPWESSSSLYYAFGAFDSTNLGDGTYFNGQIDDVRIYNRALSNSEANGVFLDTFNSELNLVGYWRFDENGGQTAFNDAYGQTPQVQLSWPSTANTDDYVISRVQAGGPFPVTIDTTSYIDTAVSVNNTYSYNVTAFGPGGASPPSVTVSVPTEYCRPSQPVITSLNTTCQASAPVNTISWTDATPFTTDEYNIYRNSTGNPPGPGDREDDVDVGTLTWTDTSGLSPLTTYYYWVQAISPDSSDPEGLVSLSRSITTYGCGLVPSTPSLSSVITACSANNLPTATATWTDGIPALAHTVYRDNPDATQSVYSTRNSSFTDEGSYALDFDGTNDYITIPDSPELSGGTPLAKSHSRRY